MQSENLLEQLLSADRLRQLATTGDLKQLLAGTVHLDYLLKSIRENVWVFDGLLDSINLGTATLANSTTYQ